MTKRVVVSVVGTMLALSGCNAGTESSALLRLEAEMAGANCPNGGLAVLTGLDANGNRTLEDAEVDAAQTRYVCNGAPGAVGTAGTTGPVGPQGDAGVAGLNALSTTVAEAAGTNCRYGGVRIDVGLDTDGDGALSAGEITGTRYVCDRASTDAIYFGDLVLRDASDLALLTGIQVIAGSLFVESTPTGTLSLPDLRVISGEFSLSPSGSTNGAPAPLTAVSLPELRRADLLRLNAGADLLTFSAPRLERVRRLEAFSNPELTALSLPALALAEEVSVNSNDKLASLSLPALTWSSSFYVSYNPLLATLTAPALRTAEYYFSVNDNPVLSECAVYRVLAGLAARPRYSSYFAGNDQTQACTPADYCSTRTVSGVTGSLRLCVKEQTFAAAQTACATFGTGANLLWLTSATEWSAVSASVLDGALWWDVWIGYTDAAAEGTWVTTSGYSAYDVTTATGFWATGEPNGGTAENAVRLNTDGVAIDDAATATHAFICRVP